MENNDYQKKGENRFFKKIYTPVIRTTLENVKQIRRTFLVDELYPNTVNSDLPVQIILTGFKAAEYGNRDLRDTK